ncbi:alpha/beta hydrolase [Nocardiopsis sp. ATB16-24]|uniref:alpha/beta fold hydrolase n=1 Tax=Nocardiopsis sp. ATB16-24 TaxID=3019555 RepID=UPI002554A275|nr:alpha/beta hydrolase [Nocardiopsis sp. ATB16-24]
MSTPRFIDLPPGVRRTDMTLSYGPVAALRAFPTSGGSTLAPALLVHGFTGSKEDFIALFQSLAQAGREVVAIDLPGNHESPGPESLPPVPGVRRPDYRLPSLGAVVAEVLEQVGEGGPVHLLGHSFGGLVCREAALTATAPPASLTLMCSGPGALSGPGAGTAGNLIAAVSMNPTAERLRQLWEEQFDAVARSRTTRPEIHDFLRRRLLSSSAVGLMHMAEELVSAPDRVDELARVDMPTLVLYGENDDAWSPREQDRMAERLGARRLVVPGAGHSPNVEAPETTASALTSFWNEAESVGRH